MMNMDVWFHFRIEMQKYTGNNHFLLLSSSTRRNEVNLINQIIGCPIGICLTQGVGGFISQYLGWPAMFYITAGCCALWCIVWLILISDRPEGQFSKLLDPI